MPGSALGTPEYMAPEQCRGEIATEKFDIYAIGVIFFEVLVGHPPFQNESFVEVMAQKGREAAPSVSNFRKDLPVRLVKLIADCLEIEPSDRPESAKLVLDRLDDILHRMPRQPSGPLAIARTGMRRGRVAAGAAVAVAAASLVLWFSGQPSTTSLVQSAAKSGVARAESVSEAGELPARVLAAAPVEDSAQDPLSPTGVDAGNATPPAAPVRTTGDSRGGGDEEILADAATAPAPTSNTAARAVPRKTATTTRSAPARSTVPAAQTARCVTLRTAVEDNLRTSRYDRAYERLDATCWADRTSYYAIKARLLYELNQDEKCIRVGKRSSAASVEKWVGRCRLRAGK